MAWFADAATFNDPQGRYTLEMPAAWKATQLNSDAAQLANGAVYVTVMVLPGGDANLSIDPIAGQTGKQCWSSILTSAVTPRRCTCEAWRTCVCVGRGSCGRVSKDCGSQRRQLA
jgi:hypothetical protein